MTQSKRTLKKTREIRNSYQKIIAITHTFFLSECCDILNTQGTQIIFLGIWSVPIIQL
jgi:hypothetical protein